MLSLKAEYLQCCINKLSLIVDRKYLLLAGLIHGAKIGDVKMCGYANVKMCIYWNRISFKSHGDLFNYENPVTKQVCNFAV